MNKIFKSLGLAGAGLLIAAGVAFAASTVNVTSTNTQGWTTDDTRPGGAVNFITDSTSPDGGNGALQLTTDATTTSKAQYMHTTITNLANVTDLSYYTKQNSASFIGGDPSYQLPVCLGGIDGDGGCVGFTTLVYEPYENGIVTPGAWQQWDVDAGQFWSSRSYTDGGTCTVVAGGGGAPFYSITELNTVCPDAVVVGFGVNIGSNNPSYNVETDMVNFNGTVYDFQVMPPVTVTIAKYLNGSHASTLSANGFSFPMVSSWSAENLGTGSGSYTLSSVGFNNPNPYEATTSLMTSGASYSTSEVTSTSSNVLPIGAACQTGKYRLIGYSTGETLSDASAATPVASSPNFTNITTDKYVVVWNESCTAPVTVNSCKNDGWRTFNTPSFKNQGDCVSYVQSNEKAVGNKTK